MTCHFYLIDMIFINYANPIFFMQEHHRFYLPLALATDHKFI